MALERQPTFLEAGEYIVDCYQDTGWDGDKTIRAHIYEKNVHEKLVRCGNCIHFKDEDGSCRKYITTEDAKAETEDFCPFVIPVTELDYCSDGVERKEDDRSETVGYQNMAENGWIRLPVDADGEYIHVGDLMETDNGIREVDVLQKSSRKWSIGLVPVGGGAFSWHDAETLHHHHAPTVEDVLREFADEFNRDDTELCDEEIIERFAAKLRLAGDAE